MPGRTDQSQSDHDLLIRVVEKQQANHETVLEKLEGVKTDVKEVKDGIATQIGRMEVRLAVLETFKETRLAEEKIRYWNDAADYVADFRSRWKLIVSVASLASGIAVFIFDHLKQWLPQTK